MNARALEGLDDEHLIEFIIAGDRSATGELYSRYYKKVYHKCVSIVRNRDEAFDLAQETLLKAFSKLDTFRHESTFSTWVFIITHRHCLSALRREKRILAKRIAGRLVMNVQMSTPAEEAYQRAEQESIMYGLLHSLSDSEQQLLTMKFRDGESIENLRNKLHTSSSAIKMRLNRSKKKLNALYSLAQTYGLELVLLHYTNYETSRQRSLTMPAARQRFIKVGDDLLSRCMLQQK